MIVVFVKHYLNDDGIEYFDEKWYPYVESRVRQQEGYESIETFNDSADSECRNIIVKFKDQETLDAWVAHDDHQIVINDLDVFRTRGWHYFWANGEEDPRPPEDVKQWNEVPLTV